MIPGTTASLEMVILGLSITSSWGNGHATTYRGLVRALAARGHRITFLERDVEWYASHRDMPHPPGCRTILYRTRTELEQCHAALVREADVVIVGSYVPEGAAVGEWVTSVATGPVAFYDIDTPVTLAKLARGDFEYLTPALVARYDLYLSFTGGPVLDRLQRELGSPMARALYCAVDPDLYFPEPGALRWDLGYMGTYSDDRQPTLERLLVTPAVRHPGGRFIVAGPQYPAALEWPRNVERVSHVPPGRHRAFYNAQRFTLNVTRSSMVAAGWSPSVRLFEAAACGTPILSDRWDGLESVLGIGSEILVPRDSREALRIVRGMPESERRAISRAARARVLASHTATHRAVELEGHLAEVMSGHLA